MKRENKYRTIFGVITFFLFCACTSNNRSTTNNQSIEKQSNNLHELERQAVELDGMFNVSARKYVDVYFTLSDIYAERQEYEKAYQTVIKGLQLDSANYFYQYRAAYFEFCLKKYREAFERLQYILTACNDSSIIQCCTELLAKFPNTPLEKETVQPMYAKSILVLVFPNTHALAADAVAERIRQDFKLSVIKEYTDVPESTEHTRDTLDAYICEYITQLYEKHSETELAPILQEIGLTKDDLKEKQNRLLFMKYAFIQSGYSRKDWEDFNREYAMQYDANSLIRQIRQYTKQKLTNPNIIGVLAITSKDIYSGEDNNNLLFGLYDRHIAIMSLHRFITPEAKNSVIINRAVMQGLASAGHLIGIPRCSIKGCARAYAHSLAEQDAKQPSLCSECIRNINTVYQSFD